jgi:hypothetical protein
VDKTRPVFRFGGQEGWSLVHPERMVISAPTEVPLDPSPELTPEETLDSAPDRPLDLSR